MNDRNICQEILDAIDDFLYRNHKLPDIIVISNAGPVLDQIWPAWLSTGWFNGSLISTEPIADGRAFFLA